MSGRNWTRRSIEELVEAYLRGKVKGGVNYPTYIRYIKPMIIGNADPDSFGRIPVGSLAPAEGGSGDFSWYHPVSQSSLAYANYITPFDYFGTGTSACRYEDITGTIGADFGPSVCGCISQVKAKDPQPLDTYFRITIVPKECIFSYIKKIVVTEDGVMSDNYGAWCFVTCDPMNEYASFNNGDVKVKRTIYIPSHSTRLGDVSDVTIPIKHTDRAALNVTSSNYILNVNKEYVNNSFSAGMYPGMENGYALDSYPSYKCAISPVTSPGGRSNRFVSYVQSNYDGEFEVNGDTRPTNYLAIVQISTAPTSSNSALILEKLFMVCRMILDGFFTPHMSPIDFPQYYMEKPVFGSPLNKYWCTPNSLSGNVPEGVVEYKYEVYNTDT